MYRLFCLFFFFWANFSIAQIQTQPKEPLVKDPFFTTPSKATTSSTERIELIHSDEFSLHPDKYGGNPFFSGNVKFSHKGSILTADQVILYREENFVKAIGNVRLANADGSVITAKEMEYDGNTERGIARKNVVLTDPKQTIKTETLYYDRKINQAYFNTGGTIISEQSTMYTKLATYDVSTKMIDFTGDVKINNPDYIIEGSNIKQNQNTRVAEFFGPTRIINRENPENYVYTEQGRYLMNDKEAYLNKNSRIHYNGKVLYGDQMYYNQNTGFGRAKDNVTLDDPMENRYIKGGYGEIYEKIDSAMITEKPYAVKVLEKDSIYFSAERILAYQKLDSLGVKKSFLRAYRKARMYKSNAQARSDSLRFNETDGIMHLEGAPYLWSGAKQVTGNKVEVYFDTEKEAIDSVKVLGNGFAISKADSTNLKDEFNQVKGRVLLVNYENNEIKTAQALGNAQAITYADSENEETLEMERIGVVLSTCGTIEVLFEGKKVQIISCNVGAKSDTYPMSMIEKEKRFFPDFNWNTKDRLQKWQDIFEDSPNYPVVEYESDNSLYEMAQKERDRKRAESRPEVPVRTRK